MDRGEAHYVIANLEQDELGLLTPYPNVPYHLNEWSPGKRRPQNKEEPYNLQHSRLRMAAKHVFGRVKRKFKILISSVPEHGLEYQILIVYACTSLWNFIRAHGDNQEQPLLTRKKQISLRL